MPQSDLDGLRGILLGLGLKELPKLMQALHKSRAMGRNLDAGRSPDDHGAPQANGDDPLQSQLLPLVAQLMQPGAGASPAPPAGPGLSPGLRPPPTPPMGTLPRLMQAGRGLGGL